jgi:hypothetical protein
MICTNISCIPTPPYFDNQIIVGKLPLLLIKQIREEAVSLLVEDLAMIVTRGTMTTLLTGERYNPNYSLPQGR